MKQKSKKKRWLSIAGNALFWSVFGGLMFYFVSVTFFPTQAMDLYGFSTYLVTTNSMVPVIPVNSYIVVKEVEPDDLLVGDIITFNSHTDVNLDGKDNDVLTHYVADIQPYEGDNHSIKTHAIGQDEVSEWDHWTLHDEDIIGKYAFTVPVLGFLVAFLQSWYGIAVVIINIVVIVGIYLLLDKGKKKPETEVVSTSPAESDQTKVEK